MKTIDAEELSTIRMVVGGERRITHVIDEGVLKMWVGFGWVAQRKATKADKRRYPVVIYS